MMRFRDYYRLILESEDFSMLASKKFKGENVLKVTLFRCKDGDRYRVVVTSLKDPSYSGAVEFTDKAKSIVAYNNIDEYKSLVDFMKNHQKDPSAFDFAMLLKAEKVKSDDFEGHQRPFDEVPFSEPASPFGGAGNSDLGSLASVGPETSPFAAPTGAAPEAPGANPPTDLTATPPAAGTASATPPPSGTPMVEPAPTPPPVS